MDNDWRSQARCNELPPEVADGIFFIKPGYSANVARRYCQGCPVRQECLNYAIMYKERGIWAGTTEEERDRMEVWYATELRNQAKVNGRLESRDLNDFLPRRALPLQVASSGQDDFELLLAQVAELSEVLDLLCFEPIAQQEF